MKYILGIQTAEFPNEIVLIKGDSSLIESVPFNERDKTVEKLGDTLKGIVDKAKIEVEGIDLVTVCLGPGSYTGTRGGLAFAKGLCQFSNIPLIGVSTFEVLRENILSNENVENVCYLLDAKNERVFYIESSKGKNEKAIETDYLANILEKIREKCAFIGSGAVEYKEIIKDKLKDKARFVEGKFSKLSAESVARAGIRLYKKDSSIYSKGYLYKILPLYILPPSITKSKSK